MLIRELTLGDIDDGNWYDYRCNALWIDPGRFSGRRMDSMDGMDGMDELSVASA